MKWLSYDTKQQKTIALTGNQNSLIWRIFSREHEILREEVRSLQDVRSRLQTRITELEEELKKVKQEAEEKAKANK